MDIQTMHIAVKLELDKSSALELPAFEPEEIDFWLNNAIRKFVKTRYSGMNVKQDGFEQTQKRTDDLRTLIDGVILTSALLPPVVQFPNSEYFDIPSDYWFAIQEEATITISGSTSTVGIQEATYDEYRAMIDDPFSEHKIHYNTAKPIRIFYKDQVGLVGDGNYTIDAYLLTYLKAPATVDVTDVRPVDCDLPEHTHDEIIKLTVSMMLENIEQPRYQTYQRELHSVE